ncbi:secreted glucosidase [Niveomyces insectorum RCEF 264]|uniref:Secreted glucosidase n=1 Tax=Niveomyces insectorum RCEF 264 TaxID=1081102 RepID=A0A162MTD4_9HYPO|nr:secreted glucosidase [Niveomyces insectorum RCEF 264]
MRSTPFISTSLFAAALLPTLTVAIAAPLYDGLNVIWQDEFAGAAGTLPDARSWNVVAGNLNINGELETYEASNRNVQISGGGTLQLVPWKDGSGGSWTSGRVETKASFAPTPGKLTRVEGSLRMGSHAAAQKQGLWPAFFLLGEAMRTGTPWPLCGELDILEQRNGVLTGYGTAHCGTASGGICNEPNGRGGTTTMPADTDSAFHRWSVTWDLTNMANWQAQQIVWSLDGAPYFTLTGQAVGDQGTWSILAHSPFYIILNVAVGGGFPGYPNGATQDGYGSMLEAQYVAVYST